MQQTILLGLLAAFIPQLASAAQCKAIHYLNTNTAGAGPGGGSAISGNGIKVYGADGNQIGEYLPGDMDNPICQHTIAVSLPAPYGGYSGQTKCDTLVIDSCSGSYVNENDIPGAVNNSNDFYGIGIDTSSECQVLFDC